MYNPPRFEIASHLSSQHTLWLSAQKANLAIGAQKLLPEHLKKHGAVTGDKGAKLVLQGKIANVIQGIGKIKDFTPQEAAEWGESAAHTLLKEFLGDVHVVFPEELKDRDVIFNFLKGLAMGQFRIEELKSKSDSKKPELNRISISGGATPSLTSDDLKEITALAHGIAFARTILELPAGHADPSQIVSRFKDAVNKGVIEVEIWDEKRIQKEGMGLLLAVSRGSATPPRFLIARYGKDMPQKRPALYLVGKGVTFDTGGINLKTGPWRELLWMKKDMGGAAAVLGAMIALSEIKPGIPVVGVTPLTTNSIDSEAVIPGDVVTSYAGKTVEIQNTDAEGRLILADALHYAVKNHAAHIVDVATLTGACVVALGAHHSGLFTNHDEFANQVLDATERSGEPAWKMPMSARYGEELKSSIADLSNMGKSRDGGAQIGAKFLENFVGTTPWVHLDIAGSADLGEPASGGAHAAAGRMVHSLVQIAKDLAKNAKPAAKKR